MWKFYDLGPCIEQFIFAGGPSEGVPLAQMRRHPVLRERRANPRHVVLARRRARDGERDADARQDGRPARPSRQGQRADMPPGCPASNCGSVLSFGVELRSAVQTDSFIYYEIG